MKKLEIDEVPIRDGVRAVIIETNRWRPDRCMWVADGQGLPHDMFVIFPFPEIWRSICHIIIGRSHAGTCFIHLSPLTSFMRKEAAEVSKIIPELGMNQHDAGWIFDILFFHDEGREESFRILLANVLGPERTSFTQIRPADPIAGVFSLYYCGGSLHHTTQMIEDLNYEDASVIGRFNAVPIEVFE